MNIIVQFIEARCGPDLELNAFHLPAFNPHSFHFYLRFFFSNEETEA